MSRILADESVDFAIVKALRNSGYIVDAIVEMKQGIDDFEVLDYAKQNNCILLTGDKDFGEIAFKHNDYCKAIILYRLHGMENFQKAKTILNFILEYHGKLIDKFTVITAKRIRMVNFKKNW